MVSWTYLNLLLRICFFANATCFYFANMGAKTKWKIKILFSATCICFFLCTVAALLKVWWKSCRPAAWLQSIYFFYSSPLEYKCWERDGSGHWFQRREITAALDPLTYLVAALGPLACLLTASSREREREGATLIFAWSLWNRLLKSFFALWRCFVSPFLSYVLFSSPHSPLASRRSLGSSRKWTRCRCESLLIAYPGSTPRPK